MTISRGEEWLIEEQEQKPGGVATPPGRSNQ
jgi:hypothetical protein